MLTRSSLGVVDQAEEIRRAIDKKSNHYWTDSDGLITFAQEYGRKLSTVIVMCAAASDRIFAFYGHERNCVGHGGYRIVVVGDNNRLASGRRRMDIEMQRQCVDKVSLTSYHRLRSIGDIICSRRSANLQKGRETIRR